MAIVKNIVLILDCLILAATVYVLSGIDWYDEEERSTLIGFLAIMLAIIGNVGLLIAK